MSVSVRLPVERGVGGVGGVSNFISCTFKENLFFKKNMKENKSLSEMC